MSRPLRQGRLRNIVNKTTPAIVLMAIFLLTCARSNVAENKPRLMVVIVVDQMRIDHCERFRHLYTGGLKKLLADGATLTEAYFNHAATYTSTGHATIATGSHPYRHGIVSNHWYNRDGREEKIPSADDASVHVVGKPGKPGASPKNLQRDGLGDWLKTHVPTGKVYSVTAKSYSAVLMGGKKPDGVYWYDDSTGTFCSSTYYVSKYPDWVVKFNRTGTADAYHGTAWTRLLADSAYRYSRADTFAAENDGEHTSFPYRLGSRGESPNVDYYEFFMYTPFMDEIILGFAQQIVTHEKLGADASTDILFVGCSAADFIGHKWGPCSQEAQDYYLRLDRYLDAFLTFLDDAVGGNEYTVALTSDHGVLSLPEHLRTLNIDAQRILRKTYHDDVNRAAAEASSSLGVETGITHSETGIILDCQDAVRSGVSPAELRAAMADKLRKIGYVEDVFTCDELREQSAEGRRFYPYFRNGFHTERGPDLYLLFKEFTLIDSNAYGTTHGSPYDYDRHVPLMLAGKGIRPGNYNKPVRMVDLAPTLAKLIGVAATQDIDGRIVDDVLLLH